MTQSSLRGRFLEILSYCVASSQCVASMKEIYIRFINNDNNSSINILLNGHAVTQVTLKTKVLSGDAS